MKEVGTDLELLSKTLPRQFKRTLQKIRSQLSDLYDSSYPLSLAHGDLSETNIFIDSNTGRVTGIIDWEYAQIAPFGFDLWGILNFMG